MSNRSKNSSISFESSSFTDDFGVAIKTYAWVPKSPRGVVQIAHGIGEHALRYDSFARFLAGEGFAVYADDHRGHGETGRKAFRGDLSRLGRLGEGGLLATEQAIENFAEIVRSRHHSLPLIYLGHSWGSLMGQRILNRGFSLFDGVILSGSAYRMPGFMEAGDLNKNHKHLGDTGFEWLSRDEQVAQAFVSDELCFAANTLKLFGLKDSLKLFGTPKPGLKNSPFFIFSGTDDALSPRDSVERLAAAYMRVGIRDLTLKLYPGGRHEMLNETNKDEVYADVVEWIENRVF